MTESVDSDVVGVDDGSDHDMLRLEDELDHDVVTVEDELERTKKKLDTVLQEIAELQIKLSSIHWDSQKDTHLAYKTFKDNDGCKEKVRFYTGLPKWETLSILHDYLQPHLSATARNSLTSL
jgi:uncharacterized protein YhdP